MSLLLWLLACTAPEPLQVHAASSLTEAFTALAERFEAQTGRPVALTFGGSQVLRLQIAQGAPADVFASADVRQLALLADAGLVSRQEVFAHNELVAVVPADDAAGIETFADLPRARRVVLGTPATPLGSYTRQVLSSAELQLSVVSEENNARMVRAKVALGEADLAFVYRSDLIAEVRAIDIPAAFAVQATYPVAVLAEAHHPDLAAQWVEMLISDAGRDILVAHGLEAP